MIIDSSLRWMEKTGTDAWCGYSFSWAASLYARAKEGDSAARELKIFASNFCSSNSFHLNGDQKGGQYSKFTYRPFTLEGNFAFAQGLNEMLLQSYSGIIEIFPAVPASWEDITFNNLRAEGAFLISVTKTNGVVNEVSIHAEQEGILHLKLPFKTFYLSDAAKQYKVKDGIIEIDMNKGEKIKIKNGI
jgi:alpha-L-fucosidase 2